MMQLHVAVSFCGQLGVHRTQRACLAARGPRHMVEHAKSPVTPLLAVDTASHVQEQPRCGKQRSVPAHARGSITPALCPQPCSLADAAGQPSHCRIPAASACSAAQPEPSLGGSSRKCCWQCTIPGTQQCPAECCRSAKRQRRQYKAARCRPSSISAPDCSDLSERSRAV